MDKFIKTSNDMNIINLSKILCINKTPEYEGFGIEIHFINENEDIPYAAFYPTKRERNKVFNSLIKKYKKYYKNREEDVDE